MSDSNDIKDQSISVVPLTDTFHSDTRDKSGGYRRQRYVVIQENPDGTAKPLGYTFDPNGTLE